MKNEAHEKFGSNCAGSRWFNEEPKIEVTPVQAVMERWYCPIDGCDGQMKYTGMTWPTGDPGYHHKCDICDFTAAIQGAKYPRQSFRPVG